MVLSKPRYSDLVIKSSALNCDLGFILTSPIRDPRYLIKFAFVNHFRWLKLIVSGCP